MSATSTIRGLEAFFSGFGLPLYPEDGVPETDAQGARVAPPYITVQLAQPDWRDDAYPFYARVWYRSSDYGDICAKVDEIGAAIGEGVSVPASDGAIYIGKGRPFAQFQPFPGDITLKCAYLSMTLTANVP